ncbi:MAG TPA: type II toxin-antitoxin system PemK/MazF family toxin [Kiritimatiellia bacterium]|nr:type II toxin-antitoxin system PemK/MazF family toxin [Kiritimatiellia bacterium]HMP00302.1 type II toxin-antitoxin system PemK/MazF family toxin [Kiritimatiellia bacterium]
MKRYDIRWAQLDPTRGSEMAKTRPVVIVSRDELIPHVETITICPLTSRIHPGWRSRVPIHCAGQPAEIAVDQIRTISKSRLGEKLGRLNPLEAEMLRRTIAEMYAEE